MQIVFSQSKQLFSDILFMLHKGHFTVSFTENMICIWHNLLIPQCLGRQRFANVRKIQITMCKVITKSVHFCISFIDVGSQNLSTDELEIPNYNTWQKISATFKHCMKHMYLYRGMNIHDGYSYLQLSNELL